MTDQPVTPHPDGHVTDEQGAARASGPIDAVAEAVGHLQTAALSMAAAVRAALDAAEQLAKDPSPLLALLSEVARQAPSGGRAGPVPPSAEGPRVEHIAVTPKQGPDPDDRAGGVSRTSAERNDEPPDGRGRG